jgi:outer membrane protein OmpA-like peptidoglycan-associated protein
MYVTSSNYVNKPIKSTDKTVKLKIFRLVFNTATNEWGDEILDDFPYNSNQYSCAHPTISRDGQELYFVSDMPGGMGGSDIYLCKKEGAIWGQPQNLKEVNTAGEEMFPFIADNGSLYFSSDGHFGLGGLDIYVISKVDNKWSKIANLGAPLKSSTDDFAYTENESGSRGYFTSNRAGGIGDDDIYNFVKEGLKICGEVIDVDTKAKLANATVKLYEGTVLKKTTEANSIGAFCFEAEPYKKYRVVASKDGYSNNEMIVDFKNQTQNIIVPLKKSNVLTLDVLVIDFKTKLPIPASDIKLIDLKTNKEAATVTDADGKTNYGLEADVDYKIIASKDLGNSSIEQYFNNSTTFNTEGIKSRANFNITIELRKEKAGVGIKIPDIYYDLDKYNIRIDAAKELEKIVKILKDNPTMEIELSSHTDCRSGARYNMWLSAKRAEAAVNYIIRQGINPYRMVAAGYGETRLINNCACEPDNNSSCSEEEHQLNRRTEFKILKF